MSKLARRDQVRQRHRRLRRRLSGSPERPRLSVFRSNNHIYAQLIDDVGQHTIASASTVEPDLQSQLSAGGTCSAAKLVGKLIADRAKVKGVSKVVFDRGGNLYHGRVKALAEAARQNGLDF
ncbi:MAG: 50S ribosomal protein L18 [Cyanobacteria bacterium P01_H01_bin.15]